MTDRELLQWAARAVGMPPTPNAWQIPDHLPVVFTNEGRDWNPLTDDGDALRLAVALGLDVFSRPGQWAECGRIGSAGAREPYRSDPYAATRRAIVRAAAAIGEAMP